MTTAVLGTLLLATAVIMLAERRGLPLVLNLPFKGDLKRESSWFAQYGQGACAVVIILVVWRLDQRRLHLNLTPWVLLTAGMLATGFLAQFLKRVLGRIRPGRELAGRFRGPHLRHKSNWESFPSSHSACAVAMTVLLSNLYPPAALVFWVLAVTTAVLRYLMDAHWPSDVLGGIALGYGVATLTWKFMGA